MKTHTQELIEAKNEIAEAARLAKDQVASEVKNATQLIAQNAAVASKVVDKRQGDDHDLLTGLIRDVANNDRNNATRINDLKADIKEIKDGTTSRIEHLESDKLNTRDSYSVLYKTAVDEIQVDHEKRIRAIETRITQIITVGSVLSFLLTIAMFVLNYYK